MISLCLFLLDYKRFPLSWENLVTLLLYFPFNSILILLLYMYFFLVYASLSFITLILYWWVGISKIEMFLPRRWSGLGDFLIQWKFLHLRCMMPKILFLLHCHIISIPWLPGTFRLFSSTISIFGPHVCWFPLSWLSNLNNFVSIENPQMCPLAAQSPWCCDCWSCGNYSI